MNLVVLVTPVVAKEIREQHYDNKATKELIVAAHDMGVTLEPMHPNVDDENLALYFSVSERRGGATDRRTASKFESGRSRISETT